MSIYNPTSVGTVSRPGDNISTFTNNSGYITSSSLASYLPKTATVAVTGQTSDLSGTLATTGSGLYRISYVLATTAADLSAGAVGFNLAWTDIAGGTTFNSGSVVLTALGRTQGTQVVQLNSGNLTYTTNHTGLFGSATYALYVTVERLN